jgi:hypothetical protein
MNVRKLLLWLAIAVVALFVVAVGLVKLLISPDKIAAVVVPRLERIFDRPVQVGAMELTIFSGVGVRIHDIQIENAPPFQGHSLASIAAVDAKVKLIPLLIGDLKLKSLDIVGSQIYLIKDSTGAGNLAAVSLERLRTAAREEDDNELACRQISVHNGRLLYRNDSTGMRLVLGNVEASLDIGRGGQPAVTGNLRVDSLFLWSGWGDFLISPSAFDLSWEGSYALSSDSMIIEHCDWRLDKIEGRLDGAIAKLTSEPYLNVHVLSESTELVDCYDSKIVAAVPVLRDLELGGELRLDINLRGGIRDNRTTTVRGKATVTGARAKYPTGTTELRAKLVESDFNEQSLSIFTEEATIGAAPALFRLAVDNFREPTLSGEVRVSCDAGVIGQVLRLEKSKQLSGTIEAAISGFVKSVDREQARLFGSLSVADLSYRDLSGDLAIDSLNLDLNFSGTDADLTRLNLSLGGYKIQLNGTLTDFAPYVATSRAPHRRPRFDFAASADSFDLAVLTSGYRQIGDTTIVMRLLDYLFDFDSHGSLQITSGSVAGIPFADLRAAISVINRIMYSDTLTCDILGKTTSSDVVVDFNNLLAPEFEVDYVSVDIEANDFLAGLTRFENHLYGRLDVQATFKGKGLTHDEVLASLWANGKAKISDGEIVNLSLADVFANRFGIETFPHDEFDELHTTFLVENMSLQFAPLNIKKGKLVYFIEGAVDFDGGFDCRATRTLSKDEARTLSELPDAAGLGAGRSAGKAVFRLTGSADTAFVQLEALLPKD